MTKSAYFALCMNQSAAWLRASVANPSTGMRPVHIRLAKLALRKKGGDLESHYAELSASYALAA
jgi:hypothetical protein